MIKNFQSFEAIRWYSKGKLTLDPETIDKQVEDKLHIIGIKTNTMDRYVDFYILDKIYDNRGGKYKVSLYDNYMFYPSSNSYDILDENDLHLYVYSNIKQINVYENNGKMSRSGGKWIKYRWKELPEEIKSRL